MGYSRKDVEKSKMNAKKFVRYQEGAEKYSLGLTKFCNQSHKLYIAKFGRANSELDFLLHNKHTVVVEG